MANFILFASKVFLAPTVGSMAKQTHNVTSLKRNRNLSRNKITVFQSINQKTNIMNPKVDEYLSVVKKWQDELKKLRMIILDCNLTEELKWGWPCYTYHNNNIVLINGFKKYCSVLFFKGALLSEAKGILKDIGPNTQAGRQLRLKNVQEIVNDLDIYLLGAKEDDGKFMREAYGFLSKPEARKIRNYLIAIIEDSEKYIYDKRRGRRKKTETK